MKRFSWTGFLLTAFMAVQPLAPTESFAQQSGGVPSYAQQANPQQTDAPDARIAAQQRQRPAANRSAPQQPFEPLNAAQQAQLNQLLLAWQQQSQGTKTLDCKFQRWHYDNQAAPAGIHATRADGVVKYASPDKGLFRVDSLVYFKGMKEGKPEFAGQPGMYGEHWVCNGTQLIEFDRSEKKCNIQDLPPDMQGQQIFNSPLPFVFNLNAQEIQQRYWVRQVQAPAEGLILIEAWPKRQDDRAQYKMVQIALEEKTFLPKALILYAPNFHPVNAAKWDQYEFVEMKRNGVGNALANFMQNFISDKPPSDWTIFRDKFNPVVDPPAQQAANPQGKSMR
ncbi:hypothetical protein CA13_06330 [Planctomycetes bacterium CA13]|uniref:Uncharacterized protein n=1 Tax=Novipirellula herctigrandis TaxID=2527986 RepID=A0A5C5YW73_9BACT|nr:hypothetical protein CA13_06330 [Planctomycetes bacterium CA13]